VKASLAERKNSRTNPRSSLTDVLLDGTAPVKSVKAGRTVAAPQVKVTVPVGTPPARYTLLACADDQGHVGEADEADNCTATTAKVEVDEAPGSEDLTVQSFSDTYRWPQSEQSNLSYIKIFCNSAYPQKRYTLSSAIASVRDHLEELAPGGLAKLDKSGLIVDATDAERVAAGALTGGSPGLAMAAMLEAHELDPTNGSHLLNAAAIANAISLPNEALAFVDAAAGLDFLRTPAGIPHEAAALTTRGQSLIMLGKYDQAKPLFEKAKQLAPILTESDAGLATVAACKGQDDLAVRYLRRSRIVSDEPVPTTPPTEEPQQPEPQIDITRGKAMPLRQLQLPGTPEHGVALDPVYKDIQDGFSGEIQARNDEEAQIDQHLRATDDLRTDAEIDRRDSLFSLLYLTHQEGEVEAAQQAYDDQLDLLVDMKEAWWGGGTGEAPYVYDDLSEKAWDACAGSQDPNCWIKEMNRTCRPKLNIAHQAYVDELAELQDLGDNLLTVWSKRMSGIAANFIDEEAHRKALLHIEGIEMGIYAGIVQSAQAWTHYESLYETECVEPLPNDVVNPPEAAPGAVSPGNCPSGLKAISVKATLGPTSLKVNCERMEQSFSSEIVPLLHVFVDVKFDFRSGNISVWAGVKGGGKVGNVVDAGFKSGWYVKVNQQGDLVDTGWRVGPSAKVVSGGAEFSAYKDEIDLSITNSTTPGY
jgi:tetratricopeptide (TPR) repeat protein